MSQMNKLLKQAKSMQTQMMKMQEEMQKKEFEGQSGGGMVKIVLNGSNQLVSIKINPEVVNPQETEMLEDLIIAAHSSARKRVKEMSDTAYGSLTGGLAIPGM